MIQCKDCEFCEVAPDGRRTFKCDPFSNIKERECLLKWQLIRLDMLVAGHHGLLKWYDRLGPLQDKLFKLVKREIDDMEDSESWKLEQEDEEEDDFPTPP